MVKLLQAYSMVPSAGSELKHRKKVATDEISMVPIQTISDIQTIELACKTLVLRGSPLEYNTEDLEYISCEDISPIESYIASHTVSMEVANPLNWSIDLIEIDNIHIDVEYSNVELAGIFLNAKQDTDSKEEE